MVKKGKKINTDWPPNTSVRLDRAAWWTVALATSLGILLAV